jgi:hypothetical protein
MSVQAEVEYLSKRTERPIYYASSAGRDARHEIDQPMNRVTVEVADARERVDEDAPREFGQHPSGFDLLKFPSKVENFLDAGQIERIYEPEVIEFLERTTGACRVQLFDHTVRASSPELREIKNVREPATLVHNDYTSKSGFVCLEENLGEDAAELRRGRFQIVNVWRPLSDPVEDYPLALVDARSVAPAQIVDTERRSPTHVGEIQLALHDPSQRWFYFSAMRPDEVLMFKTFDSIDGGTRPCTIHTAIKLPDAPPGAKPRESIETRAFVFYA